VIATQNRTHLTRSPCYLREPATKKGGIAVKTHNFESHPWLGVQDIDTYAGIYDLRPAG